MSKITIDIDDEMLAALLIRADENGVSLDNHILSKLTANINTDILTEEIGEEALAVQDIVEQEARDAREVLETQEPAEEPPCIDCTGDVKRGSVDSESVREVASKEPEVEAVKVVVPSGPPPGELEPESPFNRPPVPKKHIPKGVPFHNKRVIGKWL